MGAHREADLSIERFDLTNERRDCRDQREHERSPGGQFSVAEASLGCALKLGEQLRGGLVGK
ncbi:MAG: hypothetical protein ABI355_07980 [Solirubrobacteraceae bacterium]